jgi:hypothetical protein
MTKSIKRIKLWALAVLLTLLVFDIGAAQQIAVDYSHKFDEFYGASWESAMAHIDAFALSLSDSPNEISVIIVCGGNHRLRGEAKDGRLV